MLAELVHIAAAAKTVFVFLKEVHDIKNHNSLIGLEIEQFITALNDNIGQLMKQPPKKGGFWARGIQGALNEASSQLQSNLENGNFKKYWNAKQTRDKLESLRRTLIDKIQLCASLATVEVVIDNNNKLEECNDKMDKFLPSMEELFKVSSAQSHLVTMAGIRTILQPMVVRMRRQDHNIEEIISVIRGNEPNVETSTDVQKFLADVLATLEELTENERDDLLDPHTMDLMKDPVKCFDGTTYDRFSVLRYNMTQKTPLKIACDDLDVRKRLFEKFDSAEAEFQDSRRRYRDDALTLASKGHTSEALSMLKNVLQWAPHDKECGEKSTKLEQELAAVAGRKEFKPQEKGLPTHLDSSKCSAEITLSTDKLSAQFSGTSEAGDCTSASAVQGNCPLPDQRSSYYFELSVINQGHQGSIAIGFADGNFKLSSMPGWEPDSYGYHGDDGQLYHGRNRGDKFGPTFTTGDTVGAGIHYATRELFFTKNGKLVGTTVKTTRAQLYPTIGLCSSNEMVKVNFGQDPFICDVDALVSGKLVGQNLPTQLKSSACSPMLRLSTDKLSASYTGHQIDSNIMLPVGAVQGNNPVPRRARFHYFEMSVENRGKLGKIGIGYADQNFKLCREPGWDPNSYGYHGDDGRLFHGNGIGDKFGPTFTTGDTVGAGIHYGTQELFFTKNGKLVGTTVNHATVRLYPTIGMQSLNEMVKVNFGQDPFICDVDAVLSELLSRKDLPTQFNSRKCSPLLTLSTDKLSAQYSGLQIDTRDTGAVQGSCPVPGRACFYYFEISVRKQRQQGEIAIGFADQNFRLSRAPGMEPNSYGYHGDDGNLYRGRVSGGLILAEESGPTFTTGDTVGAGIYYSTQAMFFTKNGQLVGTIALGALGAGTQDCKRSSTTTTTTTKQENKNTKNTSLPLYPTIGLSSSNTTVDVNFGQDPFVCDVSALIWEKLSCPCHVHQALIRDLNFEI